MSVSFLLLFSSITKWWSHSWTWLWTLACFVYLERFRHATDVYWAIEFLETRIPLQTCCLNSYLTVTYCSSLCFLTVLQQISNSSLFYYLENIRKLSCISTRTFISFLVHLSGSNWNSWQGSVSMTLFFFQNNILASCSCTNVSMNLNRCLFVHIIL